jgi:hypothetical protein
MQLKYQYVEYFFGNTLQNVYILTLAYEKIVNSQYFQKLSAGNKVFIILRQINAIKESYV